MRAIPNPRAIHVDRPIAAACLLAVVIALTAPAPLAQTVVGGSRSPSSVEVNLEAIYGNGRTPPAEAPTAAPQMRYDQPRQLLIPNLDSPAQKAPAAMPAPAQPPSQITLQPPKPAAKPAPRTAARPEPKEPARPAIKPAPKAKAAPTAPVPPKQPQVVARPTPPAATEKSTAEAEPEAMAKPAAPVAVTPRPVARPPSPARTEPDEPKSSMAARAVAPPPPPPPPASTAQPSTTRQAAPQAVAPKPRPTPAPPPPATSEPKQPAPEPETTTGGGQQLARLEDGEILQIPFRSGSSAIGTEAETKLARLAQHMRDSEARLQLKAYAESSDLNSSKARRLSLSRALAVRSFLIENGMRSTRIDVRALGFARDSGPADRVDIVLLAP